MTTTIMKNLQVNPNLIGPFRGSFCGRTQKGKGAREGRGVGIQLPSLKLVRILLET